MKKLLAALALSAVLAGCAPSQDYKNLTGAVWGTTFHITYRSADDLTDSIFAVMNHIDSTLSMFNEQSLISRINSPQSAIADANVAEVWEIAQRVNEASRGAFDPTVAPLVDLWGFGRRGRNTEIPDSASIANILDRVGIDKWIVRSGETVVKPHPDAALDFSAIAKGYGVDCIGAMLRRNSCSDYMVEVGGEIALRGHSPRGCQWRVQIDAPIDSTPGACAYSRLDTTDCAIATSGNYRNYRTDSTGTVYGHTIDPHTGYPRRKAFRSVTVIAPTCALADAVATAMMASDPDSAQAIPSRLNCQARIIP